MPARLKRYVVTLGYEIHGEPMGDEYVVSAKNADAAVKAAVRKLNKRSHKKITIEDVERL